MAASARKQAKPKAMASGKMTTLARPTGLRQQQAFQAALSATNGKNPFVRAVRYVLLQIMVPEAFRNGAPLVRGPLSPNHPDAPTGICLVRTEVDLTTDAANRASWLLRKSLFAAFLCTQLLASAPKYVMTLVPGGAGMFGNSGFNDNRDVARYSKQAANAYFGTSLTTSVGSAFVGLNNFRDADGEAAPAPLHRVNGTIVGQGPRVTATDTVYIEGFTNDTVASNFNPYAVFLLTTGAVSKVTAAAVAGATGKVLSAAMAAPSNSIAVIEIGFDPMTTSTASLTAVKFYVQYVVTLEHGHMESFPLGDPIGTDADDLFKASSIRLLSSSVRYDPQENRDFNGSAAMAVVSDPFGINPSRNLDYASISSAPASRSGDAKDGAFGFLLPGDWHSPTVEDDSEVIFGSLESNTATPSGRFVLHTIVEHDSQSVIVEKKRDPCPKPVWDAAVGIAAHGDRIYENPVHVADVVAFIRDATNVVSSDLMAAGSVMPSMKTEFSLAALAADALGKLSAGFAGLFS